jgi:putative GTP pyrophosphokinase
MGPVAERWLEGFKVNYSLYREAATIATDEIREALSGFPVALHSVTGRAKKPDSASEKVRRKSYGRPKSQMTDVIGVRVIASYAQGVEEVVSLLRDRYVIDEKNSVDKREDLRVKEVGYRSVHLVLSLGKVGKTGSAGELLANMKIEVQVRSIVDHAWAEIDHQLRYKSGVNLPKDIERRFAALAGALELVDQEFNSLANGLVTLVERYEERYNNDELMDVEFDSARLLGFVMARRPEAVRLGPQKCHYPLNLLRNVYEHSKRSIWPLGLNYSGQLVHNFSDPSCATTPTGEALNQGRSLRW